MPTAKNEVKLKFGTKAEYTSATKNADTVYFITDTNQIYIGNKLVSSKAYSGSSVPTAQQYGKGDIYLYTPANGDPRIYVHNGAAFSIVDIPIKDITANTNARHSHTNKEILDAISGTPIQVVSQTLTDEQKSQARTNIGALGTVVPNPTSDNDAANKAYVDSKVASGGVTVDSSMSDTSVNPVQNKVIKKYIDDSYDVKVTITRTGDSEPYSYQADKDYNYVLSQINKGYNVYSYCTWNKGIVPFYQISDSTSSLVFRQYANKHTTLIFLNSSNQVEYDLADNKVLTYKEQNLSDDDKLQARTNIDVMSSQEVTQALNNKSSVTIKSWTADDVGGVDVTLASGTTYIIDSQSLQAIEEHIEAPDGKILIELPSAILADNNGQGIIQEPTKLYLGYGYNAIGDRNIYLSKFNPTKLLGSNPQSVEFTYPYIEYAAGDVSGTGERMGVQNTINSNSTINYAQVQILSNVTVSSKQKQMLFEA